MNPGDRWYPDAAGPPAHVRRGDCGHAATPVMACGNCGGPVTATRTTALPGPGGRTGQGARALGPLLAARGRDDEAHPIVTTRAQAGGPGGGS
ncbi:hypothetical protein AB0C76_31325 [Kitasatospora sp. NPDC048722]|uniref:hypothetical protein n=1 Tax=Kitasatospora sp. NPDC048722 TaxID=3155639 RepID=UPI0033F8D5F7